MRRCSIFAGCTRKRCPTEAPQQTATKIFGRLLPEQRRCRTACERCRRVAPWRSGVRGHAEWNVQRLKEDIGPAGTAGDRPGVERQELCVRTGEPLVVAEEKLALDH